MMTDSYLSALNHESQLHSVFQDSFNPFHTKSLTTFQPDTSLKWRTAGQTEKRCQKSLFGEAPKSYCTQCTPWGLCAQQRAQYEQITCRCLEAECVLEGGGAVRSVEEQSALGQSVHRAELAIIRTGPFEDIASQFLHTYQSQRRQTQAPNYTDSLLGQTDTLT